jgi:hypothetical protein
MDAFSIDLSEEALADIQTLFKKYRDPATSV